MANIWQLSPESVIIGRFLAVNCNCAVFLSFSCCPLSCFRSTLPDSFFPSLPPSCLLSFLPSPFPLPLPPSTFLVVLRPYLLSLKLVFRSPRRCLVACCLMLRLRTQKSSPAPLAQKLVLLRTLPHLPGRAKSSTFLFHNRRLCGSLLPC